MARAAGTGGGRTKGGRTPWVYYSVLLLVVILGIVGVVNSRDHRLSQINAQGNVPPLANQADWHMAYSIYICGKYLPPITNTNDPEGINTEGDSLIYIHPFSNSSAGKNATLGKFASAVGMTLNAGELKVPGHRAYYDGDKCQGKPGLVQVQQFANAKDTVGYQQSIDPKDVQFTNNGMVTIAFMPRHAKIPPPTKAAIAALSHPKNVPITRNGKPPVTTTTTVPPSTTVPSTSSTVPSTTTSGGSTTTGASSTTATTASNSTSTTAKK